MNKKLRTPLLITTAVSTAATVAATLSYQRWRSQRKKELRSGSRLAPTAVGPVEYGLQPGPRPDSPMVLLAHGAPGGYDQGFLLGPLAPMGFTILTPSRPGYLHTPLDPNQTPARQADLFAALLDTLQIERVAMLGMSAGGPAALQFALRHPDRLWALVLEAAVSRAYTPPEAVEQSMLGKLFLNDTAQDLLMWLFTRFTWMAPEPALKEMLRVETRFDEERIQMAVREIMNDPLQVRWFQQLADTTAPIKMRKRGLDNDLQQLAMLPDYPLAEIKAPTLVMHSHYDNDVPFAHAQFVTDTVPGAELFTADACGHFLWLGQDATMVFERRLAFLRRHAPGQE